MPSKEIIKSDESSVVIQEVRLAMQRMKGDIARPAIALSDPSNTSVHRNKLHENLQKQADQNEAKSSSEQPSLPAGFYLHALKIPEMIAYFRKLEKNSPFPEKPNEFFAKIQNPPIWVRQQFGVRKEDINLVQKLFDDLTKELHGQVPILWLFVDLTDITRTAFGGS